MKHRRSVGGRLRNWVLCALATGLLADSARACRYNVRDAGFVDFEPAPYRLVVLTNAVTPTNLVAGLRAATAEAWLDANVKLEFASAARPPDPLPPPTRTRAATAPTNAFLLLPDGRVRTLPLPRPPRREVLWAFAEGIVSSPLRRQLLDAMPDHFAAVLLAEGPDADANARARRVVDGALERLTERLPRMPKPVKHPPVLLTRSWRTEAPADALALASLELTASTNRAEPEVAIVYGRGRRCGPPLRGPELTETALLEALTILGQDCECDLDRSWLHGPLMPLRWDAEQQRRVVAELGFDAESPLVRMEIARIIARGPNPAARRLRFDGAGGGLEALGYAEGGMDEPAATPENPISEAPADVAKTSAPAAAAAEVPLASPPASGQTAAESKTSASPAGAVVPGSPPVAAPQPSARMSLSILFLAGIIVVVVALVFLFSGKSD